MIAIQVPTPSVSVSGVPDPITSTINGTVGGVVSGVNGVLPRSTGSSARSSPVAAEPAGWRPAGWGGASGGGGSTPGGGTGTIYHPTGPTVAQRTVPQGYGNGSGVGGSYVAAGSTGSARQRDERHRNGDRQVGRHQQQPIKSGGSPKTVDLAADKPRSALAAGRR